MKRLVHVNVWRLVWAEIVYNLFVHVMLFLALMFSFYLFGSLNRQGVFKDPSLPHLLAVALMYLLFTSRFAEKRTRFTRTLPVTQAELGRARLYSQALYWIGVIVIYMLSIYASLPADKMAESCWRLLALNALLLTGNAAYCLSFDLLAGSSRPTFLRAACLVLIWLVVLKMGAVYLEGSVADFLPKADITNIFFIYKTPLGVVVQYLVAVFFSILSLRVYIQRKSFIN